MGKLFIPTHMTPMRAIMRAPTLGDLPVGNEISLIENGLPTLYVLAHKGSPSPMYVGFDGGVVMLRKDAIYVRAWNNSGNNEYQTSWIHAYALLEHLNTIEQTIRDQIREVRIPHRAGSSGSTVESGINGLLCRSFSLAFNEVFPNSTSTAAQDGVLLSLFRDTANTLSAAEPRRVTNRSDHHMRPLAVWHLRTPNTTSNSQAWLVNTTGALSSSNVTVNNSIRPAFVLPASYSP
jgi:hypothetical protein